MISCRQFDRAFEPFAELATTFVKISKTCVVEFHRGNDRVPYFGVALQCLPGTELVLTLTSGMTSVIKNDRRLRLVKAPQELHAFHFLMAWHPRLNTDPRHLWLRKAVRSTVAPNG